MPASAMVGTSGSKEERFLVVTPSARSLPPRISAKASWIGAVVSLSTSCDRVGNHISDRVARSRGHV